MAIIDAQVHLWRKGTPSPPYLATPYLVEDAIRGMDEAGSLSGAYSPDQSVAASAPDPALMMQRASIGCLYAT
jgi:hypothetical protein